MPHDGPEYVLMTISPYEAIWVLKTELHLTESFTSIEQDEKTSSSTAPCKDKDKMESNDERVSDEEDTIEENRTPQPVPPDTMIFTGQYGEMIRTINGGTYLIKDIIGIDPLVPNPGNLIGSIIHVQGYKYKWSGETGVMDPSNNTRITSIMGQIIKS